ncbi:hypothetical protein EDD15DRAFT_2125055, partial [Pisolithus albus]
DLQPWEKYPCELEDMCKWAVVAKDKSSMDKSRENIIIYRNPPDTTSNALYPVSVRLYGCLQKFTVGKFGNWDGYKSKLPFAPISSSYTLQADDTSPTATNDFPADTASKSQLRSQDSPLGLFRTNASWEWNDALPILQLTARHECVPLHEIRLNNFDFIEIDAEFNVVISRGKEGMPVVKVYLSFKHIVRLLDATSMK